ncbi:MAG: response regulator [Nitrospinota bacterium]|nr:response regulator [Nitrospinota bacterium]MDH5677065.1 response regulator [Nitrospinota bacterium]MDH5755293.1 response regulator [Nitrospinota bacterium]
MVQTAKTILVVDDDEAHLLWSQEILGQSGYKIDSAISAEKALEMLQEHSYDLIISDLLMPGMSGMDFVRKIGEVREGQKAIIMTGHGDIDSFIESVHGLGALEYVTKPIATKDFINMVNKLTA